MQERSVENVAKVKIGTKRICIQARLFEVGVLMRPLSIVRLLPVRTPLQNEMNNL